MRNMNGKEMKAHLESAGIRAAKCVYRSGEGVYITDFYVPEIRTEIPSGKEWGEKIKSAFPGQIEIVRCDEIRADWREGNPIIHAAVTFTYTATPLETE